MKAYNLVIKCPRCVVIEDEKLIDFIEEKLHPDADVDYFGHEIDNGHDFEDDVLIDLINNTTYITIHFEHPTEVTKAEALKILKESIRERLVEVSVSDEKDVEVLFIT